MATLYGHAVIIKGLNADHTYVTSSDGNRWGCWGRDSGGHEICSGRGSVTEADCLSQSSSHAGLVYGITGVCHQTANRILFPAKVIVNKAKGYWASVTVYGTYGTANLISLYEWKKRKDRCCKRKDELEPSDAEELSKAPVQDERLAAYLENVDTMYSEEMRDTKEAGTDSDNKINVLGNELALMADFRLGGMKKDLTIKTLQDVQAEMILKKERLDAQLNEKHISAAQYADEVNANIPTLLNESKQHLGEGTYMKLFGAAPDSAFQIVNPQILAQYQQD